MRKKKCEYGNRINQKKKIYQDYIEQFSILKLPFSKKIAGIFHVDCGIEKRYKTQRK
jgi:hypothetical protein